MNTSIKASQPLNVFRVIGFNGFKAIRKVGTVYNENKNGIFYQYLVYDKTELVGNFVCNEKTASNQHKLENELNNFLKDNELC